MISLFKKIFSYLFIFYHIVSVGVNACVSAPSRHALAGVYLTRSTILP